jgi:hypothetical protein
MNKESNKMSHADAQYEDPAKGIDHCSQCQYFEPPSGCHLVKSPIGQKAWCRFFEADYVKP